MLASNLFDYSSLSGQPKGLSKQSTANTDNPTQSPVLRSVKIGKNLQPTYLKARLDLEDIQKGLES